MYVEVVVPSVESGLGLICNLILTITLVRTWKQWRQVNHYVAFLTVGNILDALFTPCVYIAWRVATTWSGSDFSCKFFMLARYLGPSLTSMAVTALAVNVLLTSVTGNQGSPLRHGIVIGLFVLLSLPVPVSQSWIYHVNGYDENYSECVNVDYFTSQEQEIAYHMAVLVTLIFLPLGVIVMSLAAALTFNTCRRGVEGDTHSSDLVLTGVLGFVLALCCVPYDGIGLYDLVHPNSKETNLESVYQPLLFLAFAKSIINAFVCVVFCCCFLKRGRDDLPGEEYAPPCVRESCETGETEILVD